MIKAVVFDLDDTLISEYDYIKSGYTVIAKKIKNDFNIEKETSEIYNLMLNIFKKDSRNVFNTLLNELNVEYDENYIKELVKVYREHIPSINFFDDVIPCIEKLKENGIKLGIITDGYIITQKNKLKILNAYELFDKIIITDELGKEFWKPNPRPFEMMKEYFNIEYEEMMYVGDNPKKDFYIKKYYPVKTTRINRKNAIYFNIEYLENINEDISIINLKEILDFCI